jgi:glycosyltransferase involved in cell wall biosynthesis
MRVLYFIAYPQRMAGANRSLFELVTNLPTGIEPVVAATEKGRAVDAYREAGIETRVIEPGASLRQYGKAALKWSWLEKGRVVLSELLPYTLRLYKLMREYEITLVHANDPRGTFLVGAAARLTGRPLVSHLRGEVPFGGALKRFYEAFPTRFVAVSESTKRHLRPPARARSTVVYNGMRDISGRGDSIPWLESLHREEVCVGGCFASVTPFKGHHHLVRAVAALNRRGWGEQAAFVCFGDLETEPPDYACWVRALKQELGVHNLTFAGWQDDPFSFYQSVDFTVLPSFSEERLEMNGRIVAVQGNEGFPRTHLEAMCFGLPIVGTDIAGVREQVEHGTNGLVVPPSDPEALADALERMLSNAQERERMGRAGRERVLNRFSTSAYVEGVTDVYRELESENNEK